MEQTAVEWLVKKYHEVNWLRNRDEISSKYADELREVFFYQAKEMEKQQQKNFAIDFVYWLMDNCELISTEEEENVLWRYDSEDYIVDTLLKIFKNK